MEKAAADLDIIIELVSGSPLWGDFRERSDQRSPLVRSTYRFYYPGIHAVAEEGSSQGGLGKAA